MYYHESNVDFEDGSLVVSLGNGYANADNNKKLEAMFEKYRPVDCISRQSCVYLGANLNEMEYYGALEGAIYAVNPVGKVEKSDLSWYTQASLLIDEGDISGAIECAKKYWSGEPYSCSDSSLFEYRCQYAVVDHLVEESEDDLIRAIDIIQDISDHTGLSKDAVRSLVQSDPTQLRDAANFIVEGKQMTDEDVGMVALYGYGETEDCYINELRYFSPQTVSKIISSEHEDRIRQHPSYSNYLELSRSGSIPPPINTYSCGDSVTSSNRRRLLVAQELGLGLLAWNEVSGKSYPLSLGDFKDVVTSRIRTLRSEYSKSQIVALDR